MLIGAHLSIAAGIDKTLKHLDEIGGNCLQIFSSSPRDWGLPDPQKFKGIKFNVPTYFHATYLINLADGGEIGEKSKKLLIAELNLASKVGIIGSVVHLGSYKKLDSQERLLRSNVLEILEKTPENTYLIAENAGTRKIGQTLEELYEIGTWHPRIKICLDTCHLHVAGFHLRDFKMREKLEVIHANDSKDEFGSLRDRHENIGQGKVGFGEFKKIMNDSRLKNIPFILEVPGFHGEGPDAENLNILKSLCRG